MNAEEEIKQQVAAELAAGEEAVRKSRVRFAWFQIGIGLLLALLGVARFFLSNSPNGMFVTCFLIFGGTALALKASLFARAFILNSKTKNPPVS